MKLVKKNKFPQRGFSLVELLVVVGVTVIIAGTMLGFNRGSQKVIALTTEQNRFIGVLERARSLALQRYNASSTAQTCGINTVFSEGTITINARVRPVGSKVIDCGDSLVYSDVLIEKHTLENKVKVMNGISSVYFSSPYLETTFFPPSTVPVVVELGIQGFTDRSRVEITPNGSISQKFNTPN